jgi:hypothetical protein
MFTSINSPVHKRGQDDLQILFFDVHGMHRSNLKIL